ncbi:SRPBCC domain-containing protein [Streptomyces sp. H10-C2]|uniref:SRPBCC family protein n=1 Tax=unclassified Streptomyces TaxID=2593676 RepID=UPI0024BB519E|nr:MULTISPECIES: SRPBCC domain-containing protein [unclassified Streptomyces]MDJ0344075.1 SRPBCC domain-containing protein [Streptomyces sp. PH10-H1]MDJ0368614.1 SRPBCC domain-containing protein [Streptomyces sp. H10-C2]
MSKTLRRPPRLVWQFLTGPEGIALWLGAGARLGAERGAVYSTADGTTGEIRGYHVGSRIRLTHRPAGRPYETTLQVTVTPSGDGTMLRFHQERLADAAEREAQRLHWRSVMDAVTDALAPAPD